MAGYRRQHNDLLDGEPLRSAAGSGGRSGTLLSLHIASEGDQCCNSFSWPLFVDIRQQAAVFSDVAAYYELVPASISGGTEPERVWGQGVTPNFFRVAEIPMVLGPGFADVDDKAPVVVLSERLWRRRFQSDPGIIGKSISLSGHTFTVTGIVPASFHSIDQILSTEFWVPVGMLPQLVATLPPHDARDWHWLAVIARLRPGMTRAQATAELETLAQRFALAYPKTDKGNHFVFEQAGSLPPRERTAGLLFLSALSLVVLLLLGIACANVANLLFAQAVLTSQVGKLRRIQVLPLLPALRLLLAVGLRVSDLGQLTLFAARQRICLRHFRLQIPQAPASHYEDDSSTRRRSTDECPRTP